MKSAGVSVAVIASLIASVSSGCGSSSSAATAPKVTRNSLVACLKKAGMDATKIQEIGFAPPGGAILVDGNGGFVVGVFPDSDYASASAGQVVDLAASYVGKTTAQKNVHTVGNVVWFPRHSPFTGQQSSALNGCLAG
jgi:hypothetical protein